MTPRRDVLAAVLLAAVAAACGRESTPAKKVQATPLIHPPPIEATTYAVNGMTAFGAKLFDLVAEPTKNAVVSPFSIATAFGMARIGARGETAEQIDAVLGFPWNPHLALTRLAGDLVTTTAIPPKNKEKRQAGDKPRPPVVAIANGLFVQRGVQLVREFVDTLAAQYGAEAQRVDFRADAEKQINDWVRRQTADRIEKLFDHLDPNTALVLANAVYLKADWAIPFMDEEPRPGNFRGPSGQLTVPMMGGLDSRRHGVGEGWQAVELAYAGDELAMWVLVPTGDAAPAELLAPKILTAVAKALTQKQVSLSMPRWDFATDLDLVPLLRRLGMVAPFAAADFSGMLPGVVIDQVVHRANITVDRWGTEAAAVTGLSALLSARQAEARVQVDRPFAFAVMHLPTKTPLFLGQVVDPLALR